MAWQFWSALIGGVSGGVVSFLSFWLNWGIEKKRRKLDRKYELLDRWRTGIGRLEGNSYQEAIGAEWYETLRPYLSKEVRDRAERPRTTTVDPGTGRAIRNQLAEEVDCIEREWGLRPS